MSKESIAKLRTYLEPVFQIGVLTFFIYQFRHSWLLSVIIGSHIGGFGIYLLLEYFDPKIKLTKTPQKVWVALCIFLNFFFSFFMYGQLEIMESTTPTLQDALIMVLISIWPWIIVGGLYIIQKITHKADSIVEHAKHLLED